MKLIIIFCVWVSKSLYISTLCRTTYLHSGSVASKHLVKDDRMSQRSLANKHRLSRRLYSKFVDYDELGSRTVVQWEEKSSSLLKLPHSSIETNITESSMRWSYCYNFIKNCFLPNGEITNDYYTFTFWRASQRLVSATHSVFGTQALLLALGFKRTSIGLAAATTWVMKDALGKLSRILWASRHGRKFDSDAKKWRFRSSLLFAAGNALEIMTYLMPSMFLVTAAVANALKQMSMLTSSSTRNTMFVLTYFSINIISVDTSHSLAMETTSEILLPKERRR